MIKLSPKHRKLFAFLELKAGVAEAENDDPIWVQVALEGDYQGYDPPFNLNRAIFQEMVDNLHKHPAFSLGADGRGNADVIQWDFEHVSESIDDNVAQIGAPAQGWVLDLEVRVGGDGKAQLWALTRWLPLAKEYIQGGQYKWASIAFYEHVRDQKSGADQGATLTSIAMTNHPFIEGMEALAARRDHDMIVAGYWEAADTSDEALKLIKRVLQLPETAELSMVTGELGKLRQWVSSGGTPLGVDLKSIFGDFRKILNLPVLTSEIEVLDETDKLITRIIQEQAIQSGQPAAPAALPESTAMVAKRKERNMEFLKTLARMLGVREDADESVIKAAVEGLVALRDGVKKTFAADKDNTGVLLEAAEEVVSLRRKGDEKLVGLRDALGTKEGEDPISRIAVLLKAETELGELKPKLEALSKDAEARENEKAEEDVTRALSQHDLPDNVRAALLDMRKNNPEGFAKDFPLAPPEYEHLTQVITTSTRQAEPTPAQQQQGNVINLANYPGRNDVERMENYILASVPGSDKWSRDRMYDEVHRMRRAQGGR